MDLGKVPSLKASLYMFQFLPTGILWTPLARFDSTYSGFEPEQVSLIKYEDIRRIGITKIQAETPNGVKLSRISTVEIFGHTGRSSYHSMHNDIIASFDMIGGESSSKNPVEIYKMEDEAQTIYKACIQKWNEFLLKQKV